ATGLTNGQDYWFEVFSRDANGNWAAGAATGPHQPSLVDSDAPCAAADLRITSHDETSVTIQFTAPYEDCSGSAGNVSAYMVRYHPTPITAGNWDQAWTWNDSYTTGLVAAGANQQIVLTGLDSNSRFWIQVKAVDDWPNVGPVAALLASGGTCETDSNCESTHLHTGWNIAGNEDQLQTTNTCLGVFGVTSCMYWVSTGVGDWAGSYVDTTGSGVVEEGRGYWLGAAGNEDLIPPGDATPWGVASVVEVSLQKGMNLIANPFPDAVSMTSLEIVQNPGGGETVNTWENAILAGWIYPSLYAYDGSNYFTELWDSGGCMHSRHGYWLKLAVDDVNTYAIRITKP
ncbi:MAG: fibronectin type III domain-containing protein, partial [Deltaproteobacteria bacterium]|nr:fibronectin type III domain-containing protein [Deltaproteobacteria bacterium]